MHDLIAALISFFFIDPLQAEMGKRLAAAGAPQAVVASVASCVRSSAPAIVERAAGDPWWATSTAFAVWTGSTKPDEALVEAAPACRPAVEAARPFLRGRSV